MKRLKILSTSIFSIATTNLLICTSCSNKIKFDVKERVLEEFGGSNLVDSEDNIKGISSVYRESQQSYAIVDYLSQRVRQIVGQEQQINIDDAHNLWFDIEAAAGCENYPIVILQGHTDMVVDLLSPELIEEVKQNGIKVVIENNIAHSEGWKTSLGADNGAGCALALVLLQERNNFKHGKLRFLFTADEEKGTIGAKYIYDHEPNIFQDDHGKFIDYLINLDAEAKYCIYRSCAGAFDYAYTLSYNQVDEERLSYIYDIYLDGFKGGHSGNDMDKMRLSSDRAIFEILDKLISNNNKIQLISFDHKIYGDETEKQYLSSQIIQNSHVTIATDIENLNTITDEIVSYINSYWKDLYVGEDWNQIQNSIHVDLNTSLINPNFIPINDSSNVIKFIGHNKSSSDLNNGYFYGIYDWIGEGLNRRPKTSSNIGPISLNEDNGLLQFRFESFTREATKELMQPHKENYERIWKQFFPNGNIEKIMEFAPWETKRDSKLLDLIFNCYKQTGVEPWFKDSRGSVEPVWWTSINPNLDCACIGPYIDYAHSVNEILDIDTINIAFNMLVSTIEKLR